MEIKNLDLKRMWLYNTLKALDVDTKELKNKIFNGNKTTLNRIKKQYINTFTLDLKNVFRLVIKTLSKKTYEELRAFLFGFIREKLRNNFKNNKLNDKFQDLISSIYLNIKEEIKRIQKHKGLLPRSKEHRMNNLKAIKHQLIHKFDRRVNIVKLRKMKSKKLEDDRKIIKNLLDLIEWFNYTHNVDKLKYTNETLDSEDLYNILRDKRSNYCNSEDYSLIVEEILENFLEKYPFAKEEYNKLDIRRETFYPCNLSSELKRKYAYHYTKLTINNQKYHGLLQEKLQDYNQSIHNTKYGNNNLMSEFNKEDRINYNSNVIIAYVKFENFDGFYKRIANRDNIMINSMEEFNGKMRIEYMYKYDRKLLESFEEALDHLIEYYENRELKMKEVWNFQRISFDFVYEDSYRKYKDYINYVKLYFGIRFNIKKGSIFPYNEIDNEFNKMMGNKPAYKEITRKKYDRNDNIIKIKEIKEDLGNIVNDPEYYKNNMTNEERYFIEFLDIIYDLKKNRDSIKLKKIIVKEFDNIYPLLHVILTKKKQELINQSLSYNEEMGYTEPINKFLSKLEDYNDLVHLILSDIISNYYQGECVRLFDTMRHRIEVIKFQCNNLFQEINYDFSEDEIDEDEENDDIFSKLLKYAEILEEKEIKSMIFVQEFFKCIIKMYEESYVNSEINIFLEPIVQMIEESTSSLNYVEKWILTNKLELN